MVFYYQIRGGPCRGKHSHLELTADDIICYVGRDKHENEHLIKYGWPGDIWFHVDALSSAHVYFRIRNLHSNHNIPLNGIPIDDLPSDSVYDMMQICKNNSIQGSKLASCKMVYTPHSNLKKTFQMDSGTVTYHDTKLCRYGRCDKDRKRIKELEATKSQDIVIDFYEEFQQHQRNMIDRKKRERRSGGDDNDIVYDPMLDDMKRQKNKATRQGDELSGIDAALEELDFKKASGPITVSSKIDAAFDTENPNNDPVWMVEGRRRRAEADENLIFLLERGYPLDLAKAALSQYRTKKEALKKLFLTEEMGDMDRTDTEEITSARQEEREVLQAIFGEQGDDPNVIYGESDDNLDCTFRITAYEAPERYDVAPPLLMDTYASLTTYPYGPLVVAVHGGGLPEALLQNLNTLLQQEVAERATEEPGDPQIFNIATFVGEQVEMLVTAEGDELKRIEDERRAKEAEAYKQQAAEKAKEEKAKTTFANEAERRAYAKQVVASGANLSKGAADLSKQGIDAKKEKKHYNTGVSDQSLIKDLFG